MQTAQTDTNGMQEPALNRENGETDNLTGYVKQYSAGMLSWTLQRVSDTEVAKDLVQDTFLAAAEKLSSFRGDSSPKTWLYSILNYKIIDYYRAKIKQPVSMESNFLFNYFSEDGSWLLDKKPAAWNEEKGNLLDDEQFGAVLQSCLDALPEKWNIAIKLKFLMSKKGEEICKELNITPANFWQIVRRAKLQLRECLENNWFQQL